MPPTIKKLDMPLPPSKSAISKLRMSITDLDIDESVEVFDISLNTLNSTIQRCQTRLNRKFTVRKFGENNYGVWRLV